MGNLWKENWDETKKHFIDWWNHEGLVLGSWGTGLKSNKKSHEIIIKPESPSNLKDKFTDPVYVSKNVRYEMASKEWPADILPAAWPDIGTVPLCSYLGSKPEYSETNIWYNPCITDIQNYPPIIFDPENEYCKNLEQVVKETVKLSNSNYFVGMPAIISNLDVLSELRGIQYLLMDMIESPEWVHEKLDEIEKAYYIAFDRMFDIIKLEDNSNAFGYFMLWGPGKTGLLQCDSSAMFSPDMFNEFVVPYLRKTSKFLDYSMYHLDGHQCLGHLDYILDIEDLDAVEWTPDPQVPPGGDSSWYEMYRRILNSGKSVWVANLKAKEVVPLLDAIGGKGVYINVLPDSIDEFEKLSVIVDSYR